MLCTAKQLSTISFWSEADIFGLKGSEKFWVTLHNNMVTWRWLDTTKKIFSVIFDWVFVHITVTYKFDFIAAFALYLQQCACTLNIYFSVYNQYKLLAAVNIASNPVPNTYTCRCMCDEWEPLRSRCFTAWWWTQCSHKQMSPGGF